MNAFNFILKDINSILLRRGQIFPMKKSKRTKISYEIAPSNITLEILSNGASHMSPSVFIRTPLRCYLFNCPEGTSRLSHLLRLRPNQIQDVFVTKDKWENIAGISGIILNKDCTEESIRLHGPPVISEMIKSLKPMLDTDFANPPYPVRIENHDCKRDNFEDSTLFVYYLNIKNSKESRYRFNGTDSPTCTAFLVKLKPCLPPIDPLKLIELKIPRSPLISKLKSGETITLEDGRIIKPEDVIDRRRKSPESPNLLFVDLCSSENLQSISTNYLLQDFMSDKRTQQMNYVIHFTQQEIFESKEYKNWLKEFGIKCIHLILNVKGRFLPVSDAVYNIQHLLNSIFSDGFPEIFPFGQVLEGQVILQDDEKYDIRNEIDKDVGQVYFPEFLRRFSLRGTLCNDEMNPILLDFNSKSFLDERIKLEPIELQKRIEDFKQLYTNTLKSFEKKPRDVYPTVIFLGTSSAVPTKYRNVSSYLVRLSDSSNILVDCGEATYGQLLALFGPSGVDQLLTKLNVLFITHSHLDHFLGIFNLIYKRVEAFEKQEIPYLPLILVHDSVFFNLFKTYSEMFLNLNPYIISIGLPSLFCENSATERIREHNSSLDLIKHFPKNIFSPDEWNLSSAIAFQVDHTKWSCGYSFTTLKEKRKIVFSGDTRPCENIIRNGKNADLLIHECTFEDGFEKDALIKKHTTMKQAFNSSVNMGAKNVIFTHFSARYHLVPPLPDYIINAGNVSVANDLMVVPFDLLPLFPKLLPVYQYLYKEELFDFELKKNARMACAKFNERNNLVNLDILKQKRKAESYN